ncbi:hypothetical protein VPH35_128605 [Triticum aestivum]|nr:uncharacterized protein LOC123159100 isoform X2 [Triticum aestivum]
MSAGPTTARTTSGVQRWNEELDQAELGVQPDKAAVHAGECVHGPPLRPRRCGSRLRSRSVEHPRVCVCVSGHPTRCIFMNTPIKSRLAARRRRGLYWPNAAVMAATLLTRTPWPGRSNVTPHHYAYTRFSKGTPAHPTFSAAIHPSAFYTTPASRKVLQQWQRSPRHLGCPQLLQNKLAQAYSHRFADRRVLKICTCRWIIRRSSLSGRTTSQATTAFIK